MYASTLTVSLLPSTAIPFITHLFTTKSFKLEGGITFASWSKLNPTQSL
jgi:hypothetical protein